MGCTLAILGFTMYSYATIESRQRKTLTVYSSTPAAEQKGPHDSERSPLIDGKTSQV